MKKSQWNMILPAIVLLIAAALAIYLFKPNVLSFLPAGEGGSGSSAYSGTQSCRECHEKFYQLWAPSHHGLAMQPFTAELFQTKLAVQDRGLSVFPKVFICLRHTEVLHRSTVRG